MTLPSFDLVTIGRSSIDLYADQIGAAFAEIESFGAFVGGCPTNIAVGARRLGLRVALVTAVGDDPVAEFLLRFLENEGVDVQSVAQKAGRRTSAVLLGIEPPDRFPLVFYRDNCADIALDIDDVNNAPFADTRYALFTGTGLSAEPSRSATLIAMEIARSAGAQVIFDLDLRIDQWGDPRAYGVTMRCATALADVVIGTEEEVIMAASLGAARVEHSQMSSPQVTGDLEASVTRLDVASLVVKRGAQGARLYRTGAELQDFVGHEVDVVNVLGAGDAFAAGLIYGLSHGWSWPRSVHMANTVGAIVVTRQGCANFMPTEQEALELLDAKGELKC